MQELLEIVRRLRAPDGCPWDRQQTHQSLRRYLLEEAAEAVDALAGDDDAHAAEELGDVLLQVALHAVIGEEEGRYGYSDIETAIVDKLIRRHPHVFGDVVVNSAEDVERNWKAIKAAEGGSNRDNQPDSPARTVPDGLPALMLAARMGKALGWSPSESQMSGTLAQMAGDPERIAGGLLVLAQLAREAGIEPELALRDAVHAKLGASAVGQDRSSETTSRASGEPT